MLTSILGCVSESAFCLDIPFLGGARRSLLY